MSERPDRYDRADREQLVKWCKIRGKPNWEDFPTGDIRELLRLDDLDREDVARWDPG